MVDPGDTVADEAPVSTPDSNGDAQEKTGRFEFSTVAKQMWACFDCGQKRQFGTMRLGLAIKAALETGETVEQEPLLFCERCQDNRRHCFSHDEITA